MEQPIHEREPADPQEAVLTAQELFEKCSKKPKRVASRTTYGHLKGPDECPPP